MRRGGKRPTPYQKTTRPKASTGSFSVEEGFSSLASQAKSSEGISDYVIQNPSDLQQYTDSQLFDDENLKIPLSSDADGKPDWSSDVEIVEEGDGISVHSTETFESVPTQQQEITPTKTFEIREEEEEEEEEEKDDQNKKNDEEEKTEEGTQFSLHVVFV